MKVFLSYAREDSSFARRLSTDLETRGIEVWLDVDDLATTDEDRWRKSIVQGIRESAALVVVLSPDSVLSGPVERELTIAAEAVRRIIPVMHRQCELSDALMFELAGIQRVDFVDQAYELALDQLTSRLHAAAHEGARPIVEVEELASAPDDQSIGGATTPDTVEEGSTFDKESRRANRPRSIGVIVIAAVVVLTVGGILAILQVTGGGDPPMDPPAQAAEASVSSRIDQGTTTSGVDTENEVESGTRDASVSASETDGPTVPDGVDSQLGQCSAPPSSLALTEDEAAAAAVVDELLVAYWTNTWDRVRELAPVDRGRSDEDFENGFGGLQCQDYVVTRIEPVGPNRWTVVGVLFAWDDMGGGEKRTNLACREWTVDMSTRTVTWDGHQALPLPTYWVAPEDMPSMALDRCDP